MIAALFAILFSTGLWCWLLYRYDRIEPEPIKTILYVGILGGLFSAIPAGVLNEIFEYAAGMEKLPIEDFGKLSHPLLLSFSAYVGFNEEICKAAATVLFLKKLPDFNEPIDALIYSMTVALGFAAFENIGYAARYGWGILILRSFTAVPLHMGLASFWGIGIAKAKFQNEGNYVKTSMSYVAAAAILHGVYDYFQFMLPGGWLTLILALGFAYGVIHVSRKQLVYLLGQTPFVKAGTCPYCLTVNQITDRYCKACGKPLAQDYFSVCSSCGEKVNRQAKFCGKCGKELVVR